MFHGGISESQVESLGVFCADTSQGVLMGSFAPQCYVRGAKAVRKNDMSSHYCCANII